MFSSHTRAVYLLVLLAASATGAEVDRSISVYIMTDMAGVAGVLDLECAAPRSASSAACGYATAGGR